MDETPRNAASPVRALARCFADGALERRSYVVERRRLIDAIAAGDLELPEGIPESPARTVTPSARKYSITEQDDTLPLSQPLVEHSVVAFAGHETQALTVAPGSWWLVTGLVMSLCGIGTWLWLQLAPL